MTMAHSIGKYSMIPLYVLCIVLCYPVSGENDQEIKNVTAVGEFGKEAVVTCKVYPENAIIRWLFEGKNLTESDRITSNHTIKVDGNEIKVKVYTLKISQPTEKDAGTYTCVIPGDSMEAVLHLNFNGSIVSSSKGPIEFNMTEITDESRALKLKCEFEVYNQTKVEWVLQRKKGESQEDIPLKEENFVTTRHPNNTKRLLSTYTTKMYIDFFDEQNGIYVCRVWDRYGTNKTLTRKTEVLMYAPPVVNIDFAKAIGASQIYLNWTVKPYNAKISNYYLSYMDTKNGTGMFMSYTERINVTATYFIMKGNEQHRLEPNTSYGLRLQVETIKGAWVATSKVAHLPNTADYPNGTVTTLSEDPVFVPNISINGFTARSMTIGLNAPPPEIADYVHYYELEERKKNDPNSTKCADHVRDHRNLPYMFNNLDPHTTYVFRARACFEYGEKRCGNWSEEMEAVTLDGIPNEPSDVHIICDVIRDQYYQGYFMNLTWGPPKQPNAEIKGYMMEVTGNSSYIDRFGNTKLETFGPLSKFMTNQTLTVRMPDLKPNTKYTVRLMAMTRSRRRGQEKVVNCTTGYGPPDYAPRPRWRKVEEKTGEEREDPKYSLRVLIPRSPERNGPICCYRVYLVRLRPGQSWTTVPAPQDMKVISYHDAHDPREPVFGAYITDVFNHNNFPKEEIILGDMNSRNLSREDNNDTCARCFYRPSQKEPPTTTVPPSTTAPPEHDYPDTTEAMKTKRSLDNRNLSYEDNNDTCARYFYRPSQKEQPTTTVPPSTTAPPEHDYPDTTEAMKTKRSLDNRELLVEPFDGQLDSLANYTLFVELIPGTDDESLYSGYTMALNTATPPAIFAANTMELALQICCAVAALLLLATLIFCIVHTRRVRKHPPRHAHVELNPIQAALRYVVGHIGGRQQLASQPPPDLPPIAIEDLAAAYAERQADSDYGFQKEFELLQMLPECYPDRTTHASEARENQPKNRYPDIKAYDQTRVKLSQIDGITGSDYINANYVMGYKEHKQFICAQGPTDTTVNDFWRMIWEHGLELIVMLTNLEEYSKVKCSKYWPDEVRGSRAFGNITVHHVSEKRYSDYIVRELKIVKQATNSEGQPIVENNGVAKRNGDCKDAESGSAPTSPRELKESNTRIVRQYHFLMWKDFAAPEHPQSILKFIKRMNEAWSHLMGRPVVVHCSAGVGRTGTLVALDCLLEQLRTTRRAAVFTTVAELRRQRNFLVQSLKQYVFVYRALVEYAHYGDTEIPASRLKTSIDRLRNTPEGADKCLMEHEFEKMMNPPVTEPVKSCSAGAVEEARARNRSPDCLPYDRNRVILAPAPPLHYSTYINASFIEAYDNSEGYIITQDPLPNTIMDFWRMVSEHNVSTVVMLSELGDGKCPRYWDDGTAQYEHISVQYEESESCPYYTRRQFRVTNNKSGDVTSVRQLQYHGWPTAPGHVPEVTRGLASLADAARPLSAVTTPTCVVHCQYGTERSALFAALCILIAQLRTERRVDVAATARKVRSQRAGTINTFLQYEFLHRAILNYAELHNLLEDS